MAAGLGLALVLTAAAPTAASNTIAKETGQACTVCHDKPGSRLLTSEGKFFEVTRSLDGYEEFTASYGSCTNCHLRKPGSQKLTKEGRLMLDLGKDMEALKKWVLEMHPAETEGKPVEKPAEQREGSSE